MAAQPPSVERVPTYCALCVSRCGAIATIEDGRFIRLDPDPSHPTGRALCAKGRAAPELVYHRDRLQYPLKRTRPKGDPNPGWQRIGWDEALALTASRLRSIADQSGPESVAFSLVSPSTSASDDSMAWVERLMGAFGSANLVVSMELCGWGRYFATGYTFGAPVPGRYLPDLENAGCILFWGYNPNHARLSHATATVAAQKRGARLIVVDPRRTEPARRADVWLQVRPGTDGALALGIAGVMIERGWFDEAFVREWTNGPLLVRSDTGRLLTEADLSEGGDSGRFFAWDLAADRPAIYDPARGRYKVGAADLALTGEYAIETPRGTLRCRTAFDLTAALCRSYTPERAESVTGVQRGEVERAARLLWEARPLAYYAWSGVEMQTNSTQTARAIAQLCVLTGSFDARGGNVLFPAVPAPNVGTDGLPQLKDPAPGLGVAERPLGPARWGFATTDELYRGILEREPYAVRGLVGFGANLLLSHGDVLRGREALAALDFYVHADLFMNPTAELADVVLPVASGFEREALKLGFEVSTEAQSLVQLRRLVAAPPGDARSDTEIVFDLAVGLGLGEHFWEGNLDAAYRYQLEPSGLSLEWLREHAEGARIPLETRYRKFAEEVDGAPQGFNTPTRKIELYSETLLAHGYAPLPEYEEPLVGPKSRPDLLQRYPLILTCTKHTLFCESQHRALPSLRRKAMDPEVELHPTAATARGIAAGDWVQIETAEGSVRARARRTTPCDPTLRAGSMAGGSRARTSEPRDTIRSAPMARTTISSSGTRQSIRSAVPCRNAPTSARSGSPATRRRSATLSGMPCAHRRCRMEVNVAVNVIELRERGREALGRYAWEEARDLLREVVALEERPADFEGLAQAYRWLNDEAATLDADERAFGLFQGERDSAAAARMAIWLALDLLDFRGQSAVANGWLQRAHRLLDGLPSTPEHGLLAGVEAYLRLMLHNDGPGAIALADNAVEIARELGPLDVEMVARAIKGLALVTTGEVEPGMSLLDEASTAALGDEIADPSVRSTILCALMDACDRVRDFDRASQWCARIREAAERWTLPAVVTVCRPHYAVVLTWRGEWAEAESELLAAIAESNATRPPMAIEGIVRLAELRLRQGRREEAAELLRQVEHEELAQLSRAELALADHDAETAVELAGRYLRRLPDDDRVERAPGLEMLARACLAAGDPALASVAAAELRAIADAIGTGALRAAGSFIEGMLAASRNGPEDARLARDALQDAVDLYAREGAPFETARARVELGRLLAKDGAHAAAVREWRSAKASLEAIGARRAAAAVGELLVPSSAAAAAPRSLPGLSERETEILQLIATGHSNREIADELVLSVRTVERHVSNIYAKLGASGKTARAVVTAHAYRVGLLPAS